VRIRRVTVAKDHGSTVELSAGVQADDRVIVSPPDGIVEGDKVRIRTASAPTGTSAPGAPRRTN
jgi:hypothetical protein